MADVGRLPGDQGEPARSPRRPTAVAVIRLILAGALLTVAFAGLRAALPAANWTSGPWHAHGTVLGIGLELVLAALLIAVELRRRRWPPSAQPAAGLNALLRVALIIGIVAIPVLILVNHKGTPSPFHLRGPRTVVPTGLPRHFQGQSGGSGAATLVLVALLAAAGLVLLVVGVLLLRRHLHGIDWADRGELIEEEPAEQLRRAVESGQAALGEIDDARLAIIACYVAMEQSLARAGAVRGDAETPDELLARAATAELVAGAEAARLTELFYEARFSSHPLPPQRRDEARGALRVLAAGLRERGERAAAAAARAGANAQPGDPDPPGDAR
jgi:hypothetical protein